MQTNKTTIVLYEEKHKEELRKLLIEVSSELFGYTTVDYQRFVDNHWALYLAVRNDKVIGLSSFIYNDYYGLRPPTVGNDYIYVLPAYRTGRAMYLLSTQAGHVSISCNLPLEHYYCSDTSKHLSRKLVGTKLYETYVYEVEEIGKIFKSLTRNHNIKES